MNWRRSRRVAAVTITVGAVAVALIDYLTWPKPAVLGIRAEAAENTKSNQGSKAASGQIKVDFVLPHAGGMARTCVVPSSIHAYESAELFAKISGYLEKLHVDIGDRVKTGQILAEIDSPELHRDVDRNKAALERAVAQVGQMNADIAAAEANLNAVKSGVARAEAGIKRDDAYSKFRNMQFLRYQEIVAEKAIDRRLADEQQEQKMAAEAAVDTAQANLVEQKALVVSAAAKVEKAKADLIEAQAEVSLAKANLAKAEVFAAYTRIVAPYDGVITVRTYHRGAFIRAADQSDVQPVLTVERTDVVRLVVYVPDNDVPFTDPEDETVTDIESLPEHKFTGKVSRIAFSQDQKTKTMRTEVDLPNDQGLLRNGMYGKTKLHLQAGNPNAFTVPSTAIFGTTKGGKGAVFVVRDGTARKTQVAISADNGVFAEITEGLTAKDRVIVANNNSLADGVAVDAHELTPIDRIKK